MAYIEGTGSGATYKPGSYTTYQQAKPKTPVAPVAPKAPTVSKTTTTPKTTTSTANATVAAQQQKLKAAGFDPGPIDGINGPMTQAAQAKYDAAQKAKATKAVAQPTQAEIDAQASKVNSLVAGVDSKRSNTITNTGIDNNRSNVSATPYSNLNTNNQSTGVQYKYNPQEMIDSINTASQKNIESQLAQIAAAYAKSRSDVNAAIPQLQQQSQAVRDQTNADYYTQTLPELRAAAEQAGVYRGGDLYKGTNIAKAAQMQALGQINQNEQNQLNNLNTNLRDIDYQEQQAQIAAQAGAQSDLQNKLLQANQFLANLDLSQQGLELDKIKQAYYQAVTDAGLTGTYNNQKTSAQQAQDWQQQFQEDQAAWEKNTNNPAVQAQILSNEISKLQLQYLPQEEQLKLKQIEQDILSGKVSMEQAKAQINNIAKQNSLEQQRINLESSQTNANLRNAQLKNYQALIEQLYTEVDPNTNNRSYVNQSRVLDYLNSLKNANVDDETLKQLASMYGIAWK